MIPKDPAILLSFINTKLRDCYKDLDTLCDDLHIKREDIEAQLASIDYHYSELRKQFC